MQQQQINQHCIKCYDICSKRSRTKIVLESSKEHQQLLFNRGEGMSKYINVYVRNKKQSNISLPLRFSFFRSIFVDNMAVKEVALKWKIQYSSAKIVARLARQNKTYAFFNKTNLGYIATKQCLYRDIDAKVSQHSAQYEMKEEQISNPVENVTQFYQNQSQKIQVLSTIGCSYNLNQIQPIL